MAIEIMNNYNNYAKDYTNTARKSDSTKESNVTTSTVELKTSTPGVTKTEQIKTGFGNVNDYSKYLQEKYSYMNTGTTSMQGVPTTVSVSSAFLKKCMNDPEKAKYLEENLAAIPDCAKMAVNGSLGTLTSLSYQIDANGNITCISSGTNDPDGKIAKENAERKAKEKKTEEEKQAKKRKEKRAEVEKTTEKRAEKSKARKEQIEKLAKGREIHNFNVSAIGTDVKSVTQNLIDVSLNKSVSARISFDIKA
ncbi:MAG: hypothetical protein HFE59_05895 [Clostridiales bacterium]|nr:hypothetical protein [Clostridiales bacterium]